MSCDDPDCKACSAERGARLSCLLDAIVSDFLDDTEHDGIDDIEQFARWVVVLRDRQLMLLRALADATPTCTDAQLKRICDRIIVKEHELDERLAIAGPALGAVLRALLDEGSASTSTKGAGPKPSTDPKDIN